MVRFFKLPPIQAIEIKSPPKVSASSGTVFWRTNFAENQNMFGAGSIVNTAEKVRTGGYVLKITSAGAATWETTATTSVVSANKKILESKVGIEFYVNYTKTTTAAGGLNQICFIVDFRDGTTFNKCGIAITMGATSADCKLQYWNSAGAWADVTAGGIPAKANVYFRVKLVVDLVNNKYVSLEFGNKSYDLSAIAIQTGASTDIGVSYLQFVVDGIDATTADGYFDDITITYDEP